MKNILLLTDFSKNSINAIRYALHLFEDDICNFYLLNVQSSSAYMSDDLMLAGNQSLHETIIENTKHKLTKLVVVLESEFKNDKFNFEIFVDYDALPDAINQIRQNKNIDLIVMGTNGVTGAKEVVFGSNTINVMRKVDCPTLVIPEGFKYRKPKDVLLPLDVFDSLSGKAFNEIVKFTKRFSNNLHLLRIKPKNEDSKEALKDKKNISASLTAIKYDYHVITDVPIEYAVNSYTQTHSIDLMMLLVQKESMFERFFTGSPTTQISNNISVPLLLFHY